MKHKLKSCDCTNKYKKMNEIITNKTYKQKIITILSASDEIKKITDKIDKIAESGGVGIEIKEKEISAAALLYLKNNGFNIIPTFKSKECVYIIRWDD